MAATVEARRLTEAHRQAQARLGAVVVRQILATWPLLDPEDLDASVRRWLAVTVPLVASNRRTSARLAANYLTTFRALELGVEVEPASPVLAEDVDTRQVATSLVVTGPAVVRRALARGDQPARALRLAQTTSARAAMRHVLNGGRETVTGTVQTDRQALGWARATSGRSCAFCSMLASRGPVYRSEATADFHSHDGCNCSTEPVYRRDAAWPPGSDRFAALWAEAKAADGDTTANFRRLIEAA